MPKNELRKCIARGVANFASQAFEDQECYFHCWGNRGYGKNGSFFVVTVGIVELKDGQIVQVSPHDIQFIDQEQNSTEDKKDGMSKELIKDWDEKSVKKWPFFNFR